MPCHCHYPVYKLDLRDTESGDKGGNRGEKDSMPLSLCCVQSGGGEQWRAEAYHTRRVTAGSNEKGSPWPTGMPRCWEPCGSF